MKYLPSNHSKSNRKNTKVLIRDDLTNYWSNWSKNNLPKSVTCIKYKEWMSKSMWPKGWIEENGHHSVALQHNGVKFILENQWSIF